MTTFGVWKSFKRTTLKVVYFPPLYKKIKMQKKDDLKLRPVIEMLTTILAYKQNNIIAIGSFSLYNI